MEQYTQENGSEESVSAEQTFDSQAFFREHLVKTDDGRLEIKSDGLGPVELALLDTEKRRRGSQASSTKEKLRADRVELELSNIKEVVPTIDKDQNKVDDALKYTDPDEYIRQSLENAGKDPYTEAFDAASKQAAQKVGQMTIESVIADHNEAHPGRQLNMGMLEMDLPPRLVNEFTDGKLSPSDFLDKASAILYAPTEVYNEVIPKTPNLGEVAGQTTPSDDGGNDALMVNYANAVL